MNKGLTYLVAACLLAPIGVWANDFPTQARVEYVLRCMDSHGGQSYDTLYPCICSIDKIASQISYDEYVEAEAIFMLRGTAGERGGVFRDPDRSQELYEKLTAAMEAAEESCFIKRN